MADAPKRVKARKARLPFGRKNQWHWRWMVLPSWRVLHRVASGVVEEDEFVGVRKGVTVCGLRGTLQMPGIFSRMGRPRCVHCCKRLGVPQGNGAPYNQGMHDK